MPTTGGKRKFFVSAIIPGDRQLGIMQFEAENHQECQEKAEAMCPHLAEFRAYEIEEFDDIPIDKFITEQELKKLGY